MSCLP